MSAPETLFHHCKNLCSNTLAESGFKHKITSQQKIDISTVTNKTKNRKRKIIWFNYHAVLMFQEISLKNYSDYWINIFQKRIKFINKFQL